MNRRKILLASGVTVSGILAGCAGDSDENGGANGNENGDENGSANGDENGEEEAENGTEDETETENESEEEELEPSISVTNATFQPEHIEPGEDVHLDTDLENTGGADGEIDLEVTADGTPLLEVTKTVDADSESTVTETITLVDEGEYDIAVNGVEAGTLTVEDSSLESYTYEGTGAEVINGVDLESGLTVVEGTHDGESNFQVQFYGEDDDQYGTVFFNEIGAYEGASAELLDPSSYMIDIEADGDWTLEVRQPRATAAEADNLPQSLEGNTPDVIGPINFSGRHVAYGDHDGDSNFQVQVFPEDGYFGEVVFNEIGEYEGETTFSHDGVGWVDVEADGNWTVEIE